VRGMILALIAVVVVFGVIYDGGMYLLYNYIIDNISAAIL